MEDSKKDPLICAACDLIIDPSVKMESAWKDLTPGSSLNSPEKITDEKETGFEKYVPKADVWTTFCKYMLDGRNVRVKMFRARHYHDLTFCPFCIRLIKKIYVFEKEISQLYERIDSMISCLRSKIQLSLDSSPREEKSAVREFMLGVKSTPKPKQENTPSPIIKDVRIVLTRVEDTEDVQKQNQEITRKPTKSPVVSEPEVQKLEVCKLEVTNEITDANPPSEPGNNENEETSKLRKSSRKRKSKNNSDEFLYFDEKTPTKQEEEEEEVVMAESDNSVGWSNDSIDGYEPYSEMDISFDQESSFDFADHEEKDVDEKGGELEAKPKIVKKVRKSEAGTKRTRNKTDSRERKTRRRRLIINQLEETDLFEWKGFKFRKLENGKMKCEHCPSVLNNQPCLILHIRKIHLREGVGIFPCDVCGKSFDRAEILKAHMFIHDEKRYQCYICGKLYHQRPNLTHHIKTHAGNFKFHCDFENCGKTFLTRGQLANHTRRHLGVKTFQCEYCSRLFIDRSELNRHLRSHAEQMPFKCHLCNSSFFIKYRLKRHYMNVHKVEPPAVIEMVESLKMPPHPAPIEVQVVINPDSSVTLLQDNGMGETVTVTTSESTSNDVAVTTELASTSMEASNTIHIVDAVFMEETVVTSEPSELHQVNPHKELITFQSMLE